jgi:hypothetical protein
MSPNEKPSERLTEDQVHAKALEMWPEVNGWVVGARTARGPAPDSQLAEDDNLVEHLKLSYLAWFSLVCGAEHLSTAIVYSNNHGPSLFSMQTLLRTAMVGGAQALWLLSPPDQAERVGRANRLSIDAYAYQLGWANDLKDIQDPGGAFDHLGLADTRATLDGITGGKTRGAVAMTTLVQAALEHLYSGPSGSEARAACMAEFRHLCSAAHALPWNLNTRAEKQTIEQDGQTGTLYLPSWTQLQAALSLSHMFLRVGWNLLEEQSATPLETS